MLRCRDPKYGFLTYKCPNCGEVKTIPLTCKSRVCAVQPTNTAVMSWKVRPMKESSIIVANWAHGLSDQPCGSPEGNVLAVARRDHAGGLVSGWAVTGFGIASSTVRRTHMNMVCGIGWKRRIRRARMKTKFQDKLDGCILEAPRCIGNGTATLTAVQSRDSPCSVRSIHRNAIVPTMVAGAWTGA